jgi:hypothetical protein
MQARRGAQTQGHAMTSKKTAAAPAPEAPAPAAAGKLTTRIVRRKLKDLRLLKKNARYMAEPEFNRLVENLRRDGTLTSLPLVYRDEVLSGNHRVQAAGKAGIDEADVIEITSELTKDQRDAIQLSHNALTGKDDPNILREIYEGLSLDWQKYSAVYEEMFKLDEEKAVSLGVPIAKYQELVIAFLPEDRQAFYDAILAVKDGRHIGNTGTALRVMADIVTQHMAAEAAAAPPPKPPKPAAKKTAGRKAVPA